MTGPIFISHSSKDNSDVDALTHALKDAFHGDIRTFNTSSGAAIRPGQSWRDRIMEAIRGSSAIVVWASNSAIESGEVAFEVGAATALEIPVIPCCVHIRTSDLRWGLDQVQAVVRLDSEEGWKQLADTVAVHANYQTALDYSQIKSLADRFKAPSDALEMHERGLTLEFTNASDAPLYEVNLQAENEPEWLKAVHLPHMSPGEKAVVLRDRGEPEVVLTAIWQDVTGAERTRPLVAHATGPRR